MENFKAEEKRQIKLIKKVVKLAIKGKEPKAIAEEVECSVVLIKKYLRITTWFKFKNGNLGVSYYRNDKPFLKAIFVIKKEDL